MLAARLDGVVRHMGAVVLGRFGCECERWGFAFVGRSSSHARHRFRAAGTALRRWGRCFRVGQSYPQQAVSRRQNIRRSGEEAAAKQNLGISGS